MSLTQHAATIEDITRLLVEDVLRPLAALPRVFARANLHIAIESNHNWTISDHIASVFLDNIRDGRHVTFSSKTSANGLKVGFWTTHKTKEVGVQLVTTLLRGDGLFFSALFFGHKQWLHDQLGRMRKIRTSSTIDGGDRHVITGKTHAHKSVQFQDDQAIALIIAAYDSHQWIDTVKRKRAEEDD